MKISFIASALLFIVLISCTEEPLITKGTISGIVTNRQFNNEPIPAATVSISGTNEEKVTGSDGRFEFVVESNTTGYTLQYSHPEFRSDENSNVRITLGGETTADIALTPIVPIELSIIDIDLGSAFTQESFTITNTRNGPLDFSVTTSADHITATPSTGRVGALNTSVIRVNLDRTGLVVGSYSEQVIVNVPNRGSAIVNLLFSVIDASAAVLSLDQTSLGYGTETRTRDLVLTNAGERILEWTTSVSDSWITLSDLRGSLNPDEQQIINVNVTRAGLDEGNYTGTINFTGNGGSTAVNVLMEVLPGNAEAVLEISEVIFDFGLTEEVRELTIANVGNVPLEWTSEISDTWISLSRSTGNITASGQQNITVSVDRTSLPEGTYQGTVFFAGNGGQKTLDVTISVPSQDPVLTVSTNQLDFGQELEQLLVTISNAGRSDLNWSGNSNANWMQLSTESGSVAPGNLQDIQVTVARGSLTDGDYTGEISLMSDGGDATVTVAMVVTGNGSDQDPNADDDSDGIRNEVDVDDDNDGLIDIRSINDLNNVRDDLSAAGSGSSGGPAEGFTGYELMVNLDFESDDSYADLSLKSQVSSGLGWEPLGTSNQTYNVVFQGNDFTIRNLLINRNSDHIGLFGSLGPNATVENLNVESQFVFGSNLVGVLAGSNYGKVINCSASGSVEGTAHVGLIAGGSAGEITETFSTGSVISDQGNAGGLVGVDFSTDDVIITNCFTDANVRRNSGSGSIGGLIGNLDGSSSVTNCYALGSVTNTGNNSAVGGLIGTVENAIVLDSYAMNGVISSIGSCNQFQCTTAGLIGYNIRGNVINCFSVSDPLSGFNRVGGIVGNGSVDISSRNYWDITTSQVNTSAGGTGLSTTDLQTPTSNDGIYSSWDPEIWDFGTAGQYPALKGMPLGLNNQRR